MSKKIIALTIMFIVSAIAIYFVFFKNSDTAATITTKGTADVDGLYINKSYVVGSDKKSGTPRVEDGYSQYHINTICYNLGIDRDDFNDLNQNFKNSQWIGAGITIVYPQKV